MNMLGDIAAIWFVIVFFGAFVQGATGFGFALVVTPLMAAFVEEADILITFVVSLSIVLSGTMFLQLKKHVQYDLMKYLLLSSLAGVILGSYLLRLWGAQELPKLLIAVFVIVFSLLIYFEVSKPIRKERLGGVVAGFFSGVFGALTSFGGPPIVLLLANQRKSPLHFKGTISLYFFIKGIFTVASLILITRVSPGILTSVLIFIPLVLLGLKAGLIMSNYISVKQFRLVVLLIVLTAATRIIVNYFRLA